MNALHAVEARVTSIEASLALFAGSFTTRELNTRQLCVSDESGAQTCITKAQLDALLARIGQAAAVEQRCAPHRLGLRGAALEREETARAPLDEEDDRDEDDDLTEHRAGDRLEELVDDAQ